MAITGDWQVEFDGLSVGGDTDFGLVEVSGMLDMPGVRTSDKVLLRQHGEHPGDDFLGRRIITLDMDIYAINAADMQTRVDEFLLAFKPGAEQAMTFQLPGAAGGDAGRVNARVRNRSVAHGLDIVRGLTRASVQLVATDPRIYADLAQSDTTGLPVATGGFDLPIVTFPWTATGSGGAPGTVAATNNGTFEAGVSLKLTGPVTDPAVTNQTNGESMSFTGTIGAGTYYIVNTTDRTVLLNGTASRYSELDASSTWLQLQPGANELKFTADAFHADASMLATWRSAFI